MADDEHESLRRVHGYIATVSTVGQPRCDVLSVRCRFVKWRMKRDDQTLPTLIIRPMTSLGTVGGSS